jgi:hypothetical protein
MKARPRWFALCAGFCAAAVVSGWISRWHRERASLSSAPVVSFATVYGYHPLANLPPYLAGLLLATLVPIALSRLFPRRLAEHTEPAPIPFPGTLLALVGTVGLAAFLITSSTGGPGGPLADLFHEGELLGFVPVFRSSSRPFEHSFFIHGFAMNVLPALLGHNIAGMRLVRMIEVAGTSIAALWLAAEAARSADRRSPGAPVLAVAAFCLLRTITYDVTATRSLVSFAQTAAILRVLREPDRPVSRVLAALTGVSLSLGFLYNYSEAGASLVAFAVATALATARGDGATRTWWRYAIPGAAAGGALLIAVLGASQVRAIAGQMAYWARYGGWIWFSPLGRTPAVEQRFLWAMLAAHGWTLAHLWGTAREAGLRAIAYRDADLCVMLGLALGSLKGSLDRADWAHLTLGGMIATVLLLSLAMRTLAAAKGWTTRVRFAAALLGALLAVQAWPKFDPRLAAVHVAAVLAPVPADDQIVPEDVRAAVATVQKAVAAQRCFYTLDSSGVWYYLFDRPSCSRFHQVTYARPQEAQLEVVDALHRERPEIILFRGYGSAPGVDEPANAEHLVYAYVLREYRPYSLVSPYWFWRRAPAPLAVGNRTVPGSAAVSVDAPPGTVRLTGWVEPPPGARWVYVTIGNELAEIAPLGPLAGGRATFNVLAPVGFLRPADRDLRITVYDPRRDELLRACSKC